MLLERQPMGVLLPLHLLVLVALCLTPTPLPASEALRESVFRRPFLDHFKPSHCTPADAAGAPALKPC